ncbi:MAG: MFS transporter [Lachnospiraceae bacterium]|nr:MFS transporter [Lachnospiraceae bacterium]
MITMEKKEHLGYTREQYKIFKKNAWIVLLAFSILYCFLYCGRQNLSYAMPAMMQEEGWTALQLGVLSSVQFWTYAFGHLVNGRLGEIIGVNKLIVIGMVLSAAMNMLIGFQASLLFIIILWAVNGYVQSMLWSPGMALLANWWPSSKRGFATGFANAFSGLGSVVTAFVVSLSYMVFPKMGWRGAFVGSAIVMLLVVAVYPFFAKEKPSKIGLPEYIDPNQVIETNDNELRLIIEKKGKLYPYIHLLKQWRFDVWMVIIACSSIARYGLLTWIPTYYTEVFQADIETGIIGSVICPLGMAAGALVIPWLSDRMWSQNRLPWVVISSIGAALTVFGFMNAEPGMIASFLLFFAGFFIYGINSLVWTFATDIGGRTFGGTATGILDCAAYIGASVQAIFFGSVLTNSGNWNLVFACIVGVLVVMIVAALVAGKGNKNK